VCGGGEGGRRRGALVMGPSSWPSLAFALSPCIMLTCVGVAVVQELPSS
jgi:hypothetical protein